MLLELGILQSVQSIYDREKKEINKMNLNHLVGIFEQKYDRSPWLVDSVKKLVEIDESERLDLKTLKETLPDRMVVDDWNRKLRHEKKMAIDGYNNPQDYEMYDNLENIGGFICKSLLVSDDSGASTNFLGSLLVAATTVVAVTVLLI